MAEDRRERRLAIHDALLQRGFERLQVPGRDGYRGHLAILPVKVPICFFVPDLDFVVLPILMVDKAWRPPDRQIPHLIGPEGVICYYASGSVVLDRYDPAGSVIQCLERAEKVMRDALAGRLDPDFAIEFASYWNESWMLYDLPSGYVGPGAIRYPRLPNGSGTTPVLCVDRSWTIPGEIRSRGMNDEEAAFIVSMDRALTVDPKGDWPPKTLASLDEWLGWISPWLRASLDKALVLGTGVYATLVIWATNGLFAARIEIPKELQKEEFLRNRRSHLPRNLHRVAASAKVELIRGDPADLDYIYGRNMGSKANLSGKSILVLGCGTIGGFLAHQVAQCGAGVGGGRLTLVDTDKFRTANLGRHLLGVPHLHRNKAVACAEFLNSMLPGASVEGFDVDAMNVSDIESYDLVVDATGEEALSTAINQRALDRRPTGPDHVFVWLMGNGAIAHALLVDQTVGMACYKCLKPTLSGQPRYRSLKPDVALEVGSIANCGDADFVTFPVSRAAAAGALACDMILDWANGRPGDRFRSQTFDRAQAFHVPNASPRRHAQCPACSNFR